MSQWVGLFRGINVGGHNMLPMKELAALLARLDCGDVRTYIQSGNVVFTGAGQARPLAERIAATVERRWGFRPHLLLLSAAQLARAIAANPFPEAESQPQSLHLWFLSGHPATAAAGPLAALTTAGERFALIGRVLYLHAPAGVGRSKFAARAESVLKVPATARNWRTVRALEQLLRE